MSRQHARDIHSQPGPRAAKQRPLPTLEEERRLARQGYRLVAGVDEVGRGPLAGPVVAGAVILDPDARLPWYDQVRDSKTLTPRQRERLAPAIWHDAVAVGVGAAESWEIEAVGIAPATRSAMVRALAALNVRPQFLLIDAMPLPQARVPFLPVIDGDARCLSVAAASVVAKVHRDRIMVETDAIYPGYGFARHKGYATPEHLAQLQLLGPCPVHRRNFAPVRSLIEGSAALPPATPMESGQRGRLGERVAAAFLESHGFTVVERNARTPWGELDLVAEQGDTLVFVEVRARSSDALGTPWESITPQKQRRLVLAAQEYLERRGWAGREWRIDAVAVHLAPRGGVRSVERLEHAVQGLPAF